ncbi:hypothetical protein D3C78_1265000 [compost metagenome]
MGQGVCRDASDHRLRRQDGPGRPAGRCQPAGPLYRQRDRTGPPGQPGSRALPGSRNRPDDRHPLPSSQEQPHRGGGGRGRQERPHRGAGPAHGGGSGAREAARGRADDPGSWRHAGRRLGQGGVREALQGGDAGGQGRRATGHPVHRRGTHPDRGRQPGRRTGCFQPHQAGAGPGRAAHHRRHHLGRVQEIRGKRRGPVAPLPAGEGW